MTEEIVCFVESSPMTIQAMGMASAKLIQTMNATEKVIYKTFTSDVKEVNSVTWL